MLTTFIVDFILIYIYIHYIFRYILLNKSTFRHVQCFLSKMLSLPFILEFNSLSCFVMIFYIAYPKFTK